MTERIVLSCKRLLLLAAGGALLAAPVLAQISPTPAKPLTYEIVSIKRHNSDDNKHYTKLLPDGYTASNISLQELVVQAYGFGTNPMTDQEVAKQPVWFRSERFDINAKVDTADAPALQKSMGPAGMAEQVAAMQNHIPTTRMLMLQALLADRFKMRTHHETKELPVYALVVAKSGSKLKESNPDDPAKGSITGNDGEIIANGMPLIFVLRILTQELGRPVLDQTGLKGNYDFNLKWTPDQGQKPASTDTSGPSIFTAVQEQLGLKLEPTKGPVDTIVIDHVEKPSEN